MKIKKQLSLALATLFIAGCQLTLNHEAQIKFAADSIVEYYVLRYETKTDKAEADGKTARARKYRQTVSDLKFIRDKLFDYWDDHKVARLTGAFDIAIAHTSDEADKKMLLYLKGRVDKYIAMLQKVEG